MTIRIGLLALLTAGFSIASAQFYSAPMGAAPGSGRIPAAAPSGIRVDQKLNTIIDEGWTFTDQFGEKRTTGEIFSERPSILMMIFYKCTSICAVELESMIKTIRGIKKEDIGDLYNLVVVSIDPQEGTPAAHQRYSEVLEKYNREGAEKGLFFLTGDEKNIDGLADQVGFRYYRDPRTGNITHPAGVMIVSPERRLIRYFVDQTYEARPILTALKDARDEVVGVKDDRPFFLACINVDPMTGQRSLNVMNAVRTGGVLTLIGLAVSILVMNRNSKREMMKRRTEVNK